jgi:8-oxo-dGTP pyrophosphatase MutT (NUDIX family)/2'-5' RNA ligase
MPRLGVVALLPEPLATHVQAWRLALAEPFRDAIAPHLTLVPPQQVADERVADAVALVDRAAAAVLPAQLTLEGAEAFLPDSPVAYLRVGRGAGTLVALERRLRASPLARRTHPFYPHVTVAQDLPEAEIRRAVADLAGFTASFTLEHIWLMVEVGRLVWRGHHLARLAGGVGQVTPAPLAEAAAASAFLVDLAGGKVLLGQRTPRAGRRHPGAWDALGGKPEPGEPLLAALARELREEAGVEPLDLATLGCWHDGERADAYYTCTGWLGRPRNAAPAEHTRLEWLTPADAAGRAMPPSARVALLRLGALIGSACLPG